MNCPKCGFEQSDREEECLRCGVIFAKLPGFVPPVRDQRSSSRLDSAPFPSEPRLARPAGRPRTGPVRAAPRSSDRVEESALEPGIDRLARAGTRSTQEPTDVELGVIEEREPRAEPRRMDKNDWLIMAVGLAIAGIAFLIGFVRQTFSTFMVLVHEMGHAIFGWIFGYPSVPAFDFMYGGGVTLWTQRSTLLLIVIYVLLGLAVYSRRRNMATVVLLVLLGVVHAILTFTPGHSVVILFMGHGTELAIATIFIYRALSGAAVSDAVERPLYAGIGFFIVFADVPFAYRLMNSSYHRLVYEDAKGGGHWMDFSRIAEQYLHVDLAVVATFFFVCCFVPIVGGYLLFRYQEYLRAAITHLWAKEGR